MEKMFVIKNLLNPKYPVSSLSVVVDRPSKTFVGGEVITGNCYITIDGSLSFSQIEIKFTGKATAEFEEDDRDKPGEHIRYTKIVKLVEMIYNPGSGMWIRFIFFNQNLKLNSSFSVQYLVDNWQPCDWIQFRCASQCSRLNVLLTGKDCLQNQS